MVHDFQRGKVKDFEANFWGLHKNSVSCRKLRNFEIICYALHTGLIQTKFLYHVEI